MVLLLFTGVFCTELFWWMSLHGLSKKPRGSTPATIPESIDGDINPDTLPYSAWKAAHRTLAPIIVACQQQFFSLHVNGHRN